jgi:Caspase domain
LSRVLELFFFGLPLLVQEDHLVGRELQQPLLRQAVFVEAATGAAIRGALDRLATRVSALPAEGAPIPLVLHFSCHGSQVPDQPRGDPDQDERDGYDETIVPSDATLEGGPEDVRDDELNRAAFRLTDAFLVGQPADERTAVALVTTRPVDFRHFAQPDLLRTYKAGPGARECRIKDMMNNEPFLQPPTTAGFAYVRVPADESYVVRLLL